MDPEEENPPQTPSPSSSPPQSQPQPLPQNPPPSLPPLQPPRISPTPPPMTPIPIPLLRPPPPPPPPLTQNGDHSTSTSAPNNDEISEESKQVRERQEKAVQDLLMKRRAFALAVPTNDSAVRARLRRLSEPVTLFGEREMERRDRLRMIMVKLDSEGQLDRLLKAHEDEEASAAVGEDGEGDYGAPQSYPFYTEGSRELLEARIRIAKYSILRAKVRIERAMRRRDDPDEDVDAEMDWAVQQVRDLGLNCSEIGDDRPLTGCSFSPDATLLATWYVYMFFSSPLCM